MRCSSTANQEAELGLFHDFTHSISWLHLGCSTGQGSLQEYDGEALGGICEAASKPNQATGRCSLCHRHLESQTSSQICPRTPGIAAFWIEVQVNFAILRPHLKVRKFSCKRKREMKVPGPQKKVLLLRPQLSLPGHPYQ